MVDFRRDFLILIAFRRTNVSNAVLAHIFPNWISRIKRILFCETALEFDKCSPLENHRVTQTKRSYLYRHNLNGCMCMCSMRVRMFNVPFVLHINAMQFDGQPNESTFRFLSCFPHYFRPYVDALKIFGHRLNAFSVLHTFMKMMVISDRFLFRTWQKKTFAHVILKAMCLKFSSFEVYMRNGQERTGWCKHARKTLEFE